MDLLPHGESLPAYYKRRLQCLKAERQSQGWDSHWLEIAEYFCPEEGRYLRGNESAQQNNNGRKRHQKIINGSPQQARRTLAGGMQGGLTSPSRPWFQLSLDDDELAEFTPVRAYLHEVRQRMLRVFARSNFYSSSHGMYGGASTFGTGCMMIEEDMRTVIRCRLMTIGEFSLACDDTNRPTTMFRQFMMRAEQMGQRFKKENLPRSVRIALETGKKDQQFEVVHVVAPNDGMQYGRNDAKGMGYKSCYFPLSTYEEVGFLSEMGYRGMPFVAPRWKAIGVDTYGWAAAMDALGDVKQLQKMEEKKLKALDKMVDPPMNAPASLRQTGGSILPGATNYVEDTRNGLVPSYLVQPNFTDMRVEIDEVQNRIKEFFFNNLFLAVLSENKEMTAQEVARRHEEKLVLLGPVLEQLQSEFLDPVIDRVYSIMESFGLLPEPPEELQGAELKVEYISLLAQAQKMVGTTAVDQLVMFTGNLAAFKPEVVDKLDGDELVDQYAEMLGVPPKVVRSDDEVDDIRAEKNQQAQAARMASMAPAAADGASALKDLSETQVNGRSAIDALTAGVGAPA